jgi:hypothetical protein
LELLLSKFLLLLKLTINPTYIFGGSLFSKPFLLLTNTFLCEKKSAEVLRNPFIRTLLGESEASSKQKMADSRIFDAVSVRKRSDDKHTTILFPKIQGIGGIFCI